MLVLNSDHYLTSQHLKGENDIMANLLFLTADILHVVRALSSEALTAEERALKGITRRTLTQLPT